MSSHIGAGYGSEYHLMRWMGRHRNEFDRQVLDEVGGTSVNWLDFGFGKSSSYDPSDAAKVKLPDREIEGLEFLDPANDAAVLQEWRKSWPQRGQQQTWDAAGRLARQTGDEWLLVEAKAHTGELRSSTPSASPSLPQRAVAAAHARQQLGLPHHGHWFGPYYQLANRLTVLGFLRRHRVRCRLLLIYFCGDQHPNSNDCPPDAAGWAAALTQQAADLGIDGIDLAALGVHKLFLPVAP